eukprot:417216_1
MHCFVSLDRMKFQSTPRRYIAPVAPLVELLGAHTAPNPRRPSLHPARIQFCFLRRGIEVTMKDVVHTLTVSFQPEICKIRSNMNDNDPNATVSSSVIHSPPAGENLASMATVSLAEPASQPALSDNII